MQRRRNIDDRVAFFVLPVAFTGQRALIRLQERAFNQSRVGLHAIAAVQLDQITGH